MPMHPDDRVDCFTSHMGLWAVDPLWMQQAVAHVLAHPVQQAMEARQVEGGGGYDTLPGGVAVISVLGAMQKGDSKFGGTSTIRTRRAVRAAANDDQVGAILLRMDTPGGHVAGTAELADEVARAAKIKPTEVFAEDLLASAGYWVASQAAYITANRAARVGSIGVLTRLIDTSEQMERDGVKVIPIASGPMKAAGMPGTPVTDGIIAEVQALVDDAADQFIEAVSAGRNITIGNMAMLANGSVFTAPKALDNMLIDEVGTFESALARLQVEQDVDPRQRSRAQVAIAKARRNG